MSSAAPSLLDTVRSMPRVSADAWQRLGWASRYLITVRAAVLPLTLHACLLGGLLALPWTLEEAGRLLLVTAGLTLAHATSNLLNDAVDWWTGLDADGYFRVRYGAHPLAQGLMRPLTHTVLLILTGSAAVALGIVVCRIAGAPAWWLAASGALVLLFYTWPLKRVGLGEPAVLLVWGPLMVGGTCWVVNGTWNGNIAVLSLLAGLGPTVVVFAKHADKRHDDAARGVRTLPVMLGPLWGPRAIALLALMQLAGVLAWALIEARWFYLIILAALPAAVLLVRVCLSPRPVSRPPGFPAEVWPLWYAAAGFRFARLSGGALMLGALLQGLWSG